MKAVAFVLVFAIGAFTGFFSRDYIDPCPGIENTDTVRVWLPQDTIFIERDPVYIQTPAKIETLYIAEQQVKAVELDTTYGDGARVETQYFFPPVNMWRQSYYPAPEKIVIKREIQTVTVTLEPAWYHKPEYTIPAGLLAGAFAWELAR
jgi:hypothetical protein